MSLFIMAGSDLFGQFLKPGFDREELTDAICLNAHISIDTAYFTGKNYIDLPKGYKKVFRSSEVGFLNVCEIWVKGKQNAVISIRGTTPKAESWMANFYAAMLPAAGYLLLSARDTFNYHLADDPKATVHAGWLISTGFLSREILPRIDSLCKAGIRDFIITGHSQGGAISYLMTSYLWNLKSTGRLPHDITFKTYCTAAPKPGNLHFAYDYEWMTQGGWAFNAVNMLDWVPEVPVSIQTLGDFNDINPFKDAKKMIKKQKFPKNLVFKHIYNRLDKPPRKAQENYEKFLGKMLSKEVEKKLPGLETPPFSQCNYYVRAGEFFVMKPDSSYLTRFIQTDTNAFVNHMHHPYIYLLDKTRLEPPGSR